MLASGYKVGLGQLDSKKVRWERCRLARLVTARSAARGRRVRDTKSFELLRSNSGGGRMHFLLVSAGATAGCRVRQNSPSKMDEIFQSHGRILYFADGGKGWRAVYRGQRDLLRGPFECVALGISRRSARPDRRRDISGRGAEHLLWHVE